MGVTKFFQIRVASVTCLLALIVLPVFFSILFLSSAYAQGMGNDPHATGLILMAPEEAEAFRAAHSRVVKVLPNRIALERINNARAKKGQPPLPESFAAPPGQELVFSEDAGASGDEDFTYSSTGSVDNSDMPCFPPIGDQGSLGSCTTFATTYYQLTHMVGRDKGWVQPDSPNYDIIFSPRWTFNFQRDSEKNGSSFWGNYNVLQNNGACTWNEFPYIGQTEPPENYRAWCMDPDAWENAINYRIDPISYILDDDLVEIKNTLDNGYLLTFGTYVQNWQYTTIEDNLGSGYDDYEVGKDIAFWVNGTRGGHAMTIVGYNDDIWTDVNKSGDIDEGELGAFRIANSWGTDSTSLAAKDNGFVWLAYDALKEVSGIKKAPRGRRIAAFPEGHVYITTVKTGYTPKLLAKFTLDHVKRNQLIVHLGISDAGETITWHPGMFNLSGGEYAFDGGFGSCPATFVLDFTDILTPGTGAKTYYLGVSDIKTGDSATLSSFILEEVGVGFVGGDLLPPLDVDAGEDYASITHAFNIPVDNDPPRAVILASPASGPSPLHVYFDGLSSYDPENSEPGALRYVWNFGSIQYSPIGVGEIIESPDYIYEEPGIYCAKLMVTDVMGASSSAIVLIYVGVDPPPPPDGGEMHVSAIDVSLESNGPFTKAVAEVTIVDANNVAVQGATVSSHWSGLTGDFDEGVTDASGKVSLKSDKRKNPSGTFTFTVDENGVTKSGWTYDKAANFSYPDLPSGSYPPLTAPALAKVTSLENAYPSPGNPDIWIPFTLSEAERVVIKIHDAAGRLVRTLDLGQKAPGAYVDREKAAYWDGKNEVSEQVASGIYFYTMQAGNSFTAMKKMVIAK
ncbi:FlgD immunoglobulin-like domain containing protein [Candidatus Poribacteria bacterium]